MNIPTDLETPAFFLDTHPEHTEHWRQRWASMTPEELRNPDKPRSRRSRTWRNDVARRLTAGGWSTIADVPEEHIADVLARPVLTAMDRARNCDYVDHFLEVYGRLNAAQLSEEASKETLLLDLDEILDGRTEDEVRSDLTHMGYRLSGAYDSTLNEAYLPLLYDVLP